MRNEYEVKETHAEILLRLSDGTTTSTQVSLEDLTKLLKINARWYRLKSKWGSYVQGHLVGSGRGAKKLRLHRIIMDCPEEMIIDHINGNGLDNRRENLRVCTQSENMQNIKIRSDNTSGYRGVTFHKRTNKWHAQIIHNGKHISLGYFSDKEQAANVVAEARMTYLPFTVEEARAIA